LASVQGPGN